MAASEELSDSDPLDEELVAYLDGELEAAARSRIERRLALDNEYRERLQRLQQAWDALDLLPRNGVGDAFTSTTVNLVVVEQERATRNAEGQIGTAKTRRLLLLLAAGLVAATIGFLLIFRQLTDHDRALVNDLPVIERVDQLSNTPSIDFLEKLQEEGLFLADSHEN